MKFLTIIALFFAVIYSVLVVHFLSVGVHQNVKEIETFSSLHVKDAKLSLCFPSNKYQRFVYVQ